MDQTLQSNYISCNSENINLLKLILATPSTRCYLMQCISFLIVRHKPTNFVTSRLKRVNASNIGKPGYDISGEIVPIQVGYDFSWVRFLLGTISPDTLSRMTYMDRFVLHLGV